MQSKQSRESRKKWIIAITLFILSGLFFSLKIDPVRPHHTDSIVYATIAREMIETGEWLVPHYNGQVDFWKPPLHYWLVAASFKLFGISAITAVIPSILLACFGVVLVWLLGQMFFNERAAWIAVLALATNIQYYEAATLAMMDLGVAIFILLSLFCFIKGERSSKPALWIVGFFLAAALATLLKGLQGIFIPLAVVGLYSWFAKRSWWWKHTLALLTGVSVFVIVSVPWYLYMCLRFGRAFWDFFLIQQNFGRLASGLELGWRLQTFLRSFFDVLGPFTLFCAFAVAAVIETIRLGRKKIVREQALVFLLTWIGIVFVVFAFSEAHGTRYFMPIVPAMSLLIGRYFSERGSVAVPARLSFRLSYYLTMAVLLVGIVVAMALGFWTFPPNRWSLVIPFVIVAVIGWISLAWSYRSKKQAWIPFEMAGILIVVLSLAFVWVIPSVDLKPNVAFIKVLHQKMMPGEVVGVDTHKSEKEFIYFGKFAVLYLEGTGQVQAFLESSQRVFCILSREHFDELPPLLCSRLQILDCQKDWRRLSSKTFRLKMLHHLFDEVQTEVLLVSNRGS